MQAVILALHLFVEEAFLFEEVEIEEAGHEQHVADAMSLELLEALQVHRKSRTS